MDHMNTREADLAHLRAVTMLTAVLGSAMLPRACRRPGALVSSRAAAHWFSSSSTIDFTTYDSAQLEMMEEMCILVDWEDNVIGHDTKKNVHLIDDVCMLPGGPPHRAFSVFLFNERNEVPSCRRSLISQRSKRLALHCLAPDQHQR